MTNPTTNATETTDTQETPVEATAPVMHADIDYDAIIANAEEVPADKDGFFVDDNGHSWKPAYKIAKDENGEKILDAEGEETHTEEYKVRYRKASLRDFVIAWQSSNSVEETCAKVGMSPSTARVKQGELKKQGVALKAFPRAKKAKAVKKVVDYADLAALALSLMGGEPATDTPVADTTPEVAAPVAADEGADDWNLVE
jgi:hypothetical protein